MLRILTAQSPLLDIAKQEFTKNYQLDVLFSLPPEARIVFDEQAYPLSGAPPRVWDNAQLSLPSTIGHRQSSECLRAAYISGKVTPIEIIQHIARRITDRDFGNALYSPFVELDLDRAMEEAKRSTVRYKNGTTLSCLDGIPVPIKDHHHMIGLPTRVGTSYLNQPMQQDSFIVKQLRQGGALLVGKTHVPEWGMHPEGYSCHFDMPRNVYDSNIGAGGSSTGTAVAVALGLSTVGLASDGGGSIRIPAALNGIFGLKPTYLRLGRTGDAVRFNTIAQTGPLGQSTADLVNLLEVVGAMPDPQDFPTGFVPQNPNLIDEWRSALGRGIKGCRIGLWRWAWNVAEDSIAQVGMEALHALEKDGAELIEVDIPYGEFHEAVGIVTLGVEMIGIVSDIISQFSRQTGDDLKLILNLLSTINAREYMQACRTRAVLRVNVAKTMAGLDLLAMPTTNLLAPPYPKEESRLSILDNVCTRELCRFSFLANLIGLPVGTVPVGMHNGLPIGVQFMGDAWDEASVIAVMAHCERLELTALPAPKGYSWLGG